MYEVRWVTEAEAVYNTLKEVAKARRNARKASNISKSSREEGLFRQVAKTINLLRQNPRHPSLQTHEFDAIANPYNSNEKVFEAYAQNRTPGAYRVFWCYGPEPRELTILLISPHP